MKELQFISSILLNKIIDLEAMKENDQFLLKTSRRKLTGNFIGCTRLVIPISTGHSNHKKKTTTHFPQLY